MAIKGVSTKDILYLGAGIVIGAIGLSLLKGFDVGVNFGLGGQPDRTSYLSELSGVRQSNLAELGFGRHSSSGAYNSFSLAGE
jgi:hypothetical protein